MSTQNRPVGGKKVLSVRTNMMKGYSVLQQFLFLFIPALPLHQALLPGDLVQEAALILVQSSHHVPCRHGNKHALNTWRWNNSIFQKTNLSSCHSICTRVTFSEEGFHGWRKQPLCPFHTYDNLELNTTPGNL